MENLIKRALKANAELEHCENELLKLLISKVSELKIKEASFKEIKKCIRDFKKDLENLPMVMIDVYEAKINREYYKN